MTRTLLHLITALLALGTGPVLAETVYRCGNVYSHAACEAGRAVEVDDARSVAEREAAHRIALDAQSLGEQMERRRLGDEARLRPALATNLGPAPVRPVSVKPVSKKRRAARNLQTDPVMVIDPGTPRSRAR